MTDNLAQSGAMQGGAASLGNGHDAQQAHAETPVSCLQVHPFVLMGMLPVPTDSVLVMRLAYSERPLYRNCVLKSPYSCGFSEGVLAPKLLVMRIGCMTLLEALCIDSLPACV